MPLLPIEFNSFDNLKAKPAVTPSIEVSAPKITLLISKSIFDKLLSEYIFPIEVSKSVQSEKLLEI